MTSKLKLLVATSVSAFAIVGATPAYAVGTDAGSDITNTVSVAYEVGGTTQTAETDSDTFKVDRKVNLLIAKTDAVNTFVAPGQQNAAVTYNVTNLTNDTIDILLSTQQLAGDDFNVTLNSGTTGAEALYYLDDGNGIFDAGDTIITHIDNLAEDASVVVHVVADIPAGGVEDDTADVVLIGQAAISSVDGDGDGVADNPALTGTVGAAFSDDSGDADDAAVTQNVFADTAGTATTGTGATPADGAGDGYHSATDTYEIATADLTVAKTSTVLWDPINGSTNPKAVPGAVVEYCISVSNAAGATTATNVALTDDISALALTYYSTAATGPATVPAANGVRTTTDCGGATALTDGETGSESSGTISGNLGSVAAGDTEALIFRVTVD